MNKSRRPRPTPLSAAAYIAMEEALAALPDLADLVGLLADLEAAPLPELDPDELAKLMATVEGNLAELLDGLPAMDELEAWRPWRAVD